MFEDLEDLAMGVAPGRWRLWRCAACACAYLDPRPGPASLGRAYGGYYTHRAPDEAHAAALFTAGDLRTRLRLGFYNAVLGHRFAGGWALAGRLAGLRPRSRSRWEHLIRHLPPPGPGARLLDVGCGAGAFLLIARALGYEAEGLEPDPEAAAAARSAGAAVNEGSLPGSGLPAGRFDQITLNHVFEHLGAPREACAELLTILRPGGRVWFTQPNLAAEGLRRFGAAWRGLEAPRHLCLYGAEGLGGLLEAAGFTGVRVLSPEPTADFYYRQSLFMAAGQVPGAGDPPGWTRGWARAARAADSRAWRHPERAESLTLVAYRPA